MSPSALRLSATAGRLLLGAAFASSQSGDRAVVPANIVVITIGANDFVPDTTTIHNGPFDGFTCIAGTMTAVAGKVGDHPNVAGTRSSLVPS